MFRPFGGLGLFGVLKSERYEPPNRGRSSAAGKAMAKTAAITSVLNQQIENHSVALPASTTACADGRGANPQG
jgi:hypothetical protein